MAGILSKGDRGRAEVARRYGTPAERAAAVAALREHAKATGARPLDDDFDTVARGLDRQQRADLAVDRAAKAERKATRAEARAIRAGVSSLDAEELERQQLADQANQGRRTADLAKARADRLTKHATGMAAAERTARDEIRRRFGPTGDDAA